MAERRRTKALSLCKRQGYFAPRGFLVPVSYMSLGTPHLSVRRADTALGRIQDFVGEMLFQVRSISSPRLLLMSHRRALAPWIS